ncbi:hypothetical protein BB561_006939, partial [Smittium simulii]
MDPHSYTHIFVLGLIFSFADAYGIGANDVSNSFATSVSSGALTLGQACFIAVFTEFAGAFFLGAKTADTIRSKIISVSLFASNPGLLMLGMLCAVVGSATWVIFATSRGWPVSSTHSITGAVLGMGIASHGFGSVNWGWSGIAKIIASWFISPVVAGSIAAILFLLTKYLVLESKNSFERGLLAVPFFFFITIFINVTFILNNGIPGSTTKISFGKIVWISAIAAGAVAILSYIFYCTWLRRKIKNNEDLKWYHVFAAPFLGPMPQVPEPTQDLESNEKKGSDSASEELPPTTLIGKAKGFLFRGVNKEVRNLDNPKLADMHARAKKYDSETENLFQFVQILSACAASFAHGSNDVANAVGPLATIYQVWNTGAVPAAKSSVPAWILAFCAIGIDIGLVTYGYHIMRSLGNNMTYTTASRGFCAEL